MTTVREDVLTFYTLRTFSLELVTASPREEVEGRDGDRTCEPDCVPVPLHCRA